MKSPAQSVSKLFSRFSLLSVAGSLGACAASQATTNPPDAPIASAKAETAPAESEPAAADSLTQAEGPRPPDFELETLGGQTLQLSQHLGKDVVLLDFWATYCDPCLSAMPHLDELYREYRAQGFVVLGISIDGPESVEQVRAEVTKLGVSFPILLDSESEVVALYNPKTSAPYSVLIGRDGRVLSKQEGYTRGSATRLQAEIEQALQR